LSLLPRARAQAIAARRGGPHTLAVPLALRLAAKIAERPQAEFFTDPRQLAAGLRDLLAAVRPDGVPVTAPDVLTGSDASARLDCAVQATGWLRSTVRDGAVLVAVLPSADPALVDTVRAFLDAGVDGVVLVGEVAPGTATTLGNLARFHRAMAHVLGPSVSGLAGAETVPLDAPVPKPGLVLTDGEVPVSAGVPAVQDWVAGVRGQP
jgi:hypothetical protein